MYTNRAIDLKVGLQATQKKTYGKRKIQISNRGGFLAHSCLAITEECAGILSCKKNQ